MRNVKIMRTSKCSFQICCFFCSGFLQLLCRYFLKFSFLSFVCWWYSLTGLLISQNFAVIFRCLKLGLQSEHSMLLCLEIVSFAIKTYAPTYMCKISAQIAIQIRNDIYHFISNLNNWAW